MEYNERDYEKIDLNKQDRRTKMLMIVLFFGWNG